MQASIGHKQMPRDIHTTVTKEYFAIPERFDKLITALRTAYANELSLDKQQTSYDDLLDALRLALQAYDFE